MSAELTDFVPEDRTITMFSTDWCGYCKRLKKMLDSEGIGYVEIDIEHTPGTEELVKQINGGNAVVPTVVYTDGSTATNPSLGDVKQQLAV